MHRIDTPNRSLNLFGAGKDGFRDGDLVNGINPTEFNASFFNTLQEELAGIIEAAGIALSTGSNAQLLAALRAAGVFQTPAQFDNTTKAATTAHVKRALGSASGSAGISVATTLDATYSGKHIYFTAASPITVTLPLISALDDGTELHFANVGSATATLSRQGTTDQINVGASNQTTISLPSTERLTLSVSAGQWMVKGGSAHLPFSGLFGASLSAQGYLKHPSGAILQWGSGTTSAGGTATVTFPIAFPNAVLFAGANINNANNSTMNAYSATTTGCSIASYVANTAAGQANNFRYFAIGN